jgi:hypothetical protein
MTSTTIHVELPGNRTKLGLITLKNGIEVVWGPVSCYGKADDQQAALHGNPTRDPLKPFGDTPLGAYACEIGKPVVTPTIAHSYGPNGYVVLTPISGQAMIAAKNGRFGILIHGGVLNGAGKLRPTFGCVRVPNEKLKILMLKLQPFIAGGVTCNIVPLT